MAKTIKNDDVIKINRKTINSDGTEELKEITIGRYYFEGSRELKQCTIQLYFDEIITDYYEKEQIAKIYKDEYINFIKDSSNFGWDILNINK